MKSGRFVQVALGVAALIAFSLLTFTVLSAEVAGVPANTIMGIVVVLTGGVVSYAAARAIAEKCMEA